VGTITDFAIVTRAEADGDPSNNSAMTTTLVQPPVVIPTNAGAALLAESCGSGNGVIDPYETVTLNLGLANVGNIPATNVVATLLATGGVTSPSGPQNYGTLLPGGPAVSNAFTFTATGTCGGTLVATLQVQAGTSNLGTVAFSFRLGVSGGGGYICCTNPCVPTHFTWDTIASPQCANVPIHVTIRARNDANGVATNFTGVMALTGSTGGALVTNTILASPAYINSSSGSWTLGYSFTPITNLSVTHVRHYFGTKVSIWTDAGTLVASQNVTSTPGTWVETALASPVQLTAGTTYRVAAYTGGGNYYWRTDMGATFPNGTINQGYELSGDGFPANSDTVRWWFVDLRYTVGSSVPVPIIPTVSGNFTQGVWTGSIRVPQIVSNLVLRADDGLRPTAPANSINVVSVPSLGMEDYGDIMLMLWPLWPAGSPNFVLETCTNLAPGAWVPIAYPPLQIEDVYLVPVDATEPHRYYRLRYSAH
jgi:hypothetical protein